MKHHGDNGVIVSKEVEQMILESTSCLIFFYLSFLESYILATTIALIILLSFSCSDIEGTSLRKCFDLFAVYHVLTTDHETLKRITKEVCSATP